MENKLSADCVNISRYIKKKLSMSQMGELHINTKKVGHLISKGLPSGVFVLDGNLIESLKQCQ